MKLGYFFLIVVTFWEYYESKKVLDHLLFLEFDILLISIVPDYCVATFLNRQL